MNSYANHKNHPITSDFGISKLPRKSNNAVKTSLEQHHDESDRKSNVTGVLEKDETFK